jgi:hypothetical protein
MAASHGKNGKILVNGYNISEYLRQYSLEMSIATADTTPFSIDSKKYITGQNDAVSSGEGFFDGAVGAIDAILEGIKGTESIWSYYPNGYTSGNYGYGYRALRTNYGIQTTVDDAVRFSLAAQVTAGEERLRSIGGVTTLSTTGSSTVLDLGAGGSSGATVYFHATAITGTVAVVVEDSPDNSTWTTLVALANVSAVGGQRVTVTGTVDRYIRITATLDGGESITFCAGIHVN